jgi:hypothetical protein
VEIETNLFPSSAQNENGTGGKFRPECVGVFNYTSWHGREEGEGLTHALRGAVKIFLRFFRIPLQDFGAEMNHGD